jgi:drug/metabolite transporter (DMT)-like permease
MQLRINPGLLLAFGSSLSFSCFNVLVRILVGELTIWGMLLVRGIVGTVAVAFLSRALNNPLWDSKRRLLASIGICGFMSSFCVTMAISLIPLYQAMALLYLYPAMSIPLASLLNREPFRLSDTIMVLSALAGSLMLIWPDHGARLVLGVGHLFGFGGGVLYGFSAVLARRLGQGNSGLEPIFHYSFYAAILVWPFSRLFGAELGIEGNLPAAIGLGVLGTLAQLLGYAALRFLPACQVGVMGTLEIVVGAFASRLIFKDPMTARTMMGAVVIIVVAIALTLMAGSARTESSLEDSCG